MEPLDDLTLGEIAARLESRVISPVEVTRQLLERIDILDGSLHRDVTVLHESALEQARQAEDEIGRGAWRGPLHGIPVAVKDPSATRGVRTTIGSRVYRDWVPPDHDACVIEKLRAAGAVLIGKLAMTEGASAEHHPDVVPPLNPWDASRWTGVSSSGSGVATAAGLCFDSLGSDTGGSIRYPSACCGVVGLKPTFGLISCHGVFPLAPSLDHVGPMGDKHHRVMASASGEQVGAGEACDQTPVRIWSRAPGKPPNIFVNTRCSGVFCCEGHLTF